MSISECANALGMHMLRPIAFAATLILAATPCPHARADPAPVKAQADPTVPVAPDTPAGRAMAKALRALDGDGGALTEADLSADFLAAVPIQKLKETCGAVKAQLGGLTFERFEAGATPTSLTAVLRAGKDRSPWRLRVGTDAAGIISTLLIQPAPDLAAPALAGWAEADERLKAAPGRVGLAVVEIVHPDPHGPGELRTVHALNATEPLAIGSAFKLYVLGAAAERVRANELSWDRPLRITGALKSLPSGELQDRPDGAELPLSEVALKMISISDNTATDMVMRLVGRAAVEAFYRARVADIGRTLPFLTTREMFSIKLSADTTLAARYGAANEAARRGALEPALGEGAMDQPGALPKGLRPGEVAASQPGLLLAAFWKVPREITTIEWFASPLDLCGVMQHLRELRSDERLAELDTILSKNPGVAIDRAVFPHVWFKGGSEPGVLNLTWLLERADGRVFALSVGWNDGTKPIDEAACIGLAIRLVELIRLEK